jgi:hypothetical protein
LESIANDRSLQVLDGLAMMTLLPQQSRVFDLGSIISKLSSVQYRAEGSGQEVGFSSQSRRCEPGGSDVEFGEFDTVQCQIAY